jgi:very-short-patch-repair endonuclease
MYAEVAVRDPAQVAIHAEIAAKINFACHQNAYPILRALRIENLSESDKLDELVICLTSDPPFLKPKVWRFDRLAAGSSVQVDDRDLSVNGDFLLGLSDTMRGAVFIRVERSGEVIAETQLDIELLSYNEWGGSGYMPELLAAFCTPNDPSVDQILRSASEILRKSGKANTIEGYQSGNRQRVWEIASAIYSAIANLHLTYSEPPASFERDGQKIRLPGQILDGRVGTCLDTALLFASAFEQAGLNPVVALPERHALVGVWLQPQELSSIVIYEAETLRKRTQLNELILIETTCVTQNPAPSFSKSLLAANSLMVPDNDGSFNAAVDIKRARMHRITPLGMKSNLIQQIDEPLHDKLELPLEEAPFLSNFDSPEYKSENETPQGRLERWQQRLLDLTLKNPLLNHRASTTSLRLICPEPGRLEDRLAEGVSISITAVPQPTTKGQAQDETLHRKRTGEVITDEYAKEALNKKQILVDLPEAELSRRAVEIYRKAQTALQEGGSNTLFLALGFLLWKKDEDDERRFRAPLILLPVSLERKSVRSGIKMVAHDDEPRFNTTLLEMLRKDFGVDIKGLDGALPTDQSGIDVNLVWNMVRQAIKEAPGFEVFEEVVLGHFSFAKYLMWKDLVDRTDMLRESPIVKHLLDTPREPYPSDIEFVDERHLDRDFKPSDLLVPCSVDGSQMAAVATADKGKDFVIIGPPGTGKSQTIANMISHLLGTGKTVLFVSEKTAALEVVHRRLADIGLGRYCLQLHSNKAKKSEVLNQLSVSWDSSNKFADNGWRSEAERLRMVRDKLNLVVDRLHHRHSNGLTPHYAIGVKVRDSSLSSRVVLSWPSASQHDANRLAKMRETVERLAIQAKAVGDFLGSPFSLVSTGEWSPQWEARLLDCASKLSLAANGLQRARLKFLKAVGIELAEQTFFRLEALAELAKLLLESYRKQTGYALESDGQDRIEALEKAVNHLKHYAENQVALSCVYAPMAWRVLDGVELERKWQLAQSSWWIKRWLTSRAISKQLRDGGAQGKPNPSSDLSVLIKLREHGEAIDRLDKQLAQFRNWEGHNTAPAVAESIAVLGQRVRVSVSKLADDANASMEIRARVRTLLNDGNDLLAPDASIGRDATSYLDAQSVFQECCSNFEVVAGESVRKLFAETDNTLEVVSSAADSILSQHQNLRDWCAWRKRRSEAVDLDLLPFVQAIEDGRVPSEEIVETFEAAYCRWWSGAVIGEDEVLRTFSTPEHNSDILRFRDVDQRYQKLTAEYIAARLGGQAPNKDDVKKSSQWGTLRHEIQKKTRHKPIRQLMQEAPDVLRTLAPCLMMSPLSVAQYLPPNQKLFDVVIFDEASQITVWDAIGSVARGKQVIVAGDPKQMPPTNFFARAENDSDVDDSVEADLESILDEMLGASIPKLTLNLHYRSRRESLIAFSNAKYYDNSLITFPAPVVSDGGVSLVIPEGYYARGLARHNEGEARAIVSEIVRRLKHPDPKISKLSIGVVTFNSQQESLIENLLDEARAKDSSIEWAFSRETVLEPVFVKNLETVQGDERDVILFSITFGPDQSGHVTMNFGPLNRSGGERRLNVAMTRARAEMIVFSTLLSEKIDLSRSQARAIADLKHFLEYAKRGPSILGSFDRGSQGDFESPFEVAVARELREKGWLVHPQVGVSAYRIDLGVIHPEKPGVYLAGIECDGAMYHSSAYARERDKIRQSVLENLGWQLHRVWSTDWWTNKEKALGVLHHKLIEQLNAAK